MTLHISDYPALSALDDIGRREVGPNDPMVDHVTVEFARALVVLLRDFYTGKRKKGMRRLGAAIANMDARYMKFYERTADEPDSPARGRIWL